MSASSTPTARPFAASAAARLTVTVDLPTPPFPEAMAYTRVRDSARANGMSLVAPPLRLSRSVPRCSSVITPRVSRTSVTPGTARTAVVTSSVSLSRSGQAAMVSSTVSSTMPFSLTSTESTMPRSVMGRRSSGSLPPASAVRPALVSASAVTAVIVLASACGCGSACPAAVRLRGEPIRSDKAARGAGLAPGRTSDAPLPVPAWNPATPSQFENREVPAVTSPMGSPQMRFRGGAGAPALPTPPTGFAVAAYPTYAQAQSAIEHLAKSDFAIEDVTIVGTDLQMAERVTGRLTAGKLAGAGAASGAWFGLFVGLLMSFYGGSQGR